MNPAGTETPARFHPRGNATENPTATGFRPVADVFEECIYDALTSLSKPQLDAHFTRPVPSASLGAARAVTGGKVLALFDG